MMQFNKYIQVGTSNRRFEFTRIENFEGMKYFITTVDEADKPVSFSMRKDKYDQWALTPGSKRWIYEITSELSDAISESLSS